MNILANLLQITIYSTLVWLVIVLFQALFGKKMSPLLRCALWLLLVARLCIPGVVPVEARLFTVPQSAAVQVKQTANALLDVPMFEESAKHPVTITSLPESGESAISQPEEPKAGWGLPFTVTFADLLLFLWGMGMGAVAVIQIAGALRIRERLRQATVLTAEYDGLVKRCKAKAGIRREIKIMVGYGLESPALTVSLCPKIILPYELLQEEDQEIEFALCHEMTHYKRGDHLIALVWCVLKCVYWFHPVVWVAQNQMRRDMETACDARVTKEMDKPTKKRYAEMILNLFSRDLENVGVAFCGLRDDAEKRIRGIFSIKKTKAAMKFVAMLVCVAMFALFFTTACQPAVEQVTEVATKMVESAPPIVSAAPQPSGPQYLEIDAPERVQQTIEVRHKDGSIVPITFDAKVIVPEKITSLPTYTVQMQGAAQEGFDRFRTYFWGNAELEDLGENLMDDNISKIHMENMNEERLQMLGDLRDSESHYIENTHENVKKIEALGLGGYICIETRKSAHVRHENSKESVLRIEDTDPAMGAGFGRLRQAIIQYYDNAGGSGNDDQFLTIATTLSDQVPYGVEQANIGISSNQALKIAQQAMQDLGYAGFEMESVHYTQSADNSAYAKKYLDGKQAAYAFQFIKPLPNGVSSNMINLIQIAVGRDGVERFEAYNIADCEPRDEQDILPMTQEMLEDVALVLGANYSNNPVPNEVALYPELMPVQWIGPELVKNAGSAVQAVQPAADAAGAMGAADGALDELSAYPVVDKIELRYIRTRENPTTSKDEILIPVWAVEGYPGSNVVGRDIEVFSTSLAMVDARTGAVYPMF